MSTDFSIKPVGMPAPAAIARPAPESARTAVSSTQLPPSQSVTQAPSATPPRTDPETRNDNLSHQIVIDRAASTMVFQVVNEQTSQVVSQVPDSFVLRRRAYVRALDAAREDARQSTRHATRTDRKI
jgi:hypothetical protein